MQAMLRLLGRWDPILYVDLHVTDGANFQPDVSIQTEPLLAGDAAMRPEGRAITDKVLASLAAQGTLPLPFYPQFVSEDDPASGFAMVPYLPRFSHAYWSQHNRYAVLVETHSWKPYPRRVAVMLQTLRALAQLTASEGSRWLTLAQAADASAARLGGEPVVLDYRAGGHVTTIDFPGFAYAREPSAVSGALWTHYDAQAPQAWRVPLYDQPEPSLTVRAARAGYIVPAAWAKEIGARLALHGIAFRRIDLPLAALAVQAFRASSVRYAKEPFEGHTPVTLTGVWHAEKRDIAAGALYVPVAQPAARVLVALLDPMGPDSLSAWGFFNNTLEQKEYMEGYVVEGVAREQLAHDPQLAQAFAQRLASDPAFAADPAARLGFFSERHPSHDERLRLYPVLAVDVPPGLRH
jgi:hypothetical protein